MAKFKNRTDQDAIFISFKEDNKLAVEMADQLADFFKSWGIVPILIKDYERIGFTEKDIYNELDKVNFFLQIMIEPKRTRWMSKEWNYIEARYAKEECNKPFLFTKEPINFSPDLLQHALIGNEWAIQKKITAILKNRKNISKIGNCFLPKYFRSDQRARLEFKDIDELLEFIGNFKSVHERGLERIYPDRKSIDESLKNRLIDLGNQKKEVRMLGFTCKRFVISEPDEDEPIGRAFKSAIDNGATARLLLLDTRCTAAYQRTIVESKDKSHKESLLVTHSYIVQKEYSLDKYKGKVEIGYHQTPYFGMVLFEDEAFVEIYNLSKFLHDRQLCGQVPILLIKSESKLFPHFESHFENIWDMWKKRYKFCSEPVD